MPRQLMAALAVMILCGCHTIGMSREKGGYADVGAPVAHEMIIDTNQVVVIDFRDPGEYEAGHVAGALSAPLSSIEHRLPELIPYQSSTSFSSTAETRRRVSGEHAFWWRRDSGMWCASTVVFRSGSPPDSRQSPPAKYPD